MPESDHQIPLPECLRPDDSHPHLIRGDVWQECELRRGATAEPALTNDPPTLVDLEVLRQAYHDLMLALGR